MSKKKSMAWGRKMTGHISKGVLNYGNIEKMGRGKGRLSAKTWRRRRGVSEANRALDAQRQVAESHIDFGIVRMYLDKGMSLEDAKREAVTFQIAIGAL